MPLKFTSVYSARMGVMAVAFSAVLGLSGLLVAAPVSVAEDLPAEPGSTAVSGARIIGQRWLTQRTLEFTVASPSFTAPVQVEVILPTEYGEDSSRSWPVTYYTNGTNHDQTLFRTTYNGEALTSSYPSLLVASRGDAGYWSDWYNNGAGGPPMYETFVTKQLIPLIDANFRTLNDRAYRAILGDSTGGYGALMLAARNPDLFVAASSLSGAVDTNWLPGAAVHSISPVLDTAIPDSIYGPRITNEVNWRGHNPVDLAANLRTVDLQFYTGNGILGASEISEPTASTGCPLEAGIILPETQSLHNALVGQGIPHKYSAYSWGCHSPAMFQQQIAESLPRFTEVFARNTPAPATFDYRSTDPEFSRFDWSVTADPDRAAEFLSLRSVSNTGFTITGSGATRITTPAIFHGNKPLTVLVNGVPTTLRPDNTGRITVTVDLGQPNQHQQYTLGATTTLRTSVVSFLR
ncbi:alpha/beta hydrolase [Paenarthrobacter sp. YIM B13468]|uniref:alpha/beta hydrolase n=1 Tax=Paenarthrobacter sp. YIM B13468 TaxID=3366295 RepID=UPI00366CDEF7